MSQVNMKAVELIIIILWITNFKLKQKASLKSMSIFQEDYLLSALNYNIGVDSNPIKTLT